MRRELDLPEKVWGYIEQCRASGLYGETTDQTVLALMRTGGFDQAVRIGIVVFGASREKRK